MRMPTVVKRLFVVLTVVLSVTPADAQEPAKPPSGRIAGRVVAMDTGKPVRWATVHMVSPEGRQTFARTDANGQFDFKGLAAGAYRLDVRAERYLPLYFGGQPYTGLSAVIPKGITLRDAEQFDKADFSLPRAGVIEGRLLDEFGDPAPGLVVQISRVVFAGGRRRLLPVGSGPPQSTDDRGYFRLHGLAPGAYYVSALSGAFAEQAQTGGFAPTYYPGTPDIGAAKPVRLAAGQELTLAFPLTPARMARVSGKVIDSDGQPVGRGSLTLSTADSTGVSDFLVTRGVTEPDGGFMFRNVPPGHFTLQGYGPAPAGGPGNLGAGSFGWLPVVVDGQDQRSLVLRVAMGPSLRGRIVTDEGAALSINPRDVHVTALPVQFDSAPVGGGPPPSTVNEDGTFEVRNMSGRRLIRVTVRNPAWMLKRVTHMSRDITDEPIDFTKGAWDGVEVVITNRVTSIGGTVTDDRANPVTDYSVIVFAADRSKWTDRSRFVAQGRPNQGGAFTIASLPPDDYFAIAVPGALGGGWQDPDFLKTLEDSATRVLLADGESKTLTLRLAVLR